jgi:hypothetical protein
MFRREKEAVILCDGFPNMQFQEVDAVTGFCRD